MKLWLKRVVIFLVILVAPILGLFYGLGLESVFIPLGRFKSLLGLIGIAILSISFIPRLKGWRPWEKGEIAHLRRTWHKRPAYLAFKRFFRHRMAVMGLVILLIFSTVAIFPHWFLLDDVPDYSSWNPYRMRVQNLDFSPSELHPLGITRSGFDVWTIIITGTRPVLGFALQAAIIAVVMGGLLGGFSGFMGGRVDRVIMMVTEMILAFPSLSIMMTVLMITSNTQHRLWLIAAFGVASTTKMVRSQALALREKEYVLAGRAVGGSDLQILFRHILTNSLPLLVVQATLFAGQAIMMDAAISFLGFARDGWAGHIGTVVRQYRAMALYYEPWLLHTAGLCILAVVFSFNILGDALRDALEVKSG